MTPESPKFYRVMLAMGGQEFAISGDFTDQEQATSMAKDRITPQTYTAIVYAHFEHSRLEIDRYEFGKENA
jgi:hypothetical protein